MQGEISAYKHTKIKDSKNCRTNFLQGENRKVVHIQTDNGGTWRKWKLTAKMKIMEIGGNLMLILENQDVGVLHV